MKTQTVILLVALLTGSVQAELAMITVPTRKADVDVPVTGSWKLRELTVEADGKLPLSAEQLEWIKQAALETFPIDGTRLHFGDTGRYRLQRAGELQHGTWRLKNNTLLMQSNSAAASFSRFQVALCSDRFLKLELVGPGQPAVYSLWFVR